MRAIALFSLLALFYLLIPTAHAQPLPAPTPVTITVESGSRQTFRGFGASLLNFGGDYQRLAPADRQALSRTLWRDLHFNTLRLWFNTDQFAPNPGAHDLTQFRTCYVDSGIIADARRNGVTTLLLAPDHLPAYIAEKRADGSSQTGMALKSAEAENYAVLVADFIDRLRRETGVAIDVTGVRNEPNDTFRLTPAQIVTVVKRLRVELDRRGLRRVRIIATENASVDGSLYAQIDALKADPVAWADLSGIASHSYNMAANAEIDRRIEGTDKSYWMTEASDNGPEVPGDALRAASVAARFLNDMNHGVTNWVHFVGFETPDVNDNATHILAYTTAPYEVTTFEKYYYYRQLSDAFDVGAVFHRALSSTEGDMTYSYGKKPRINAAAGRNPDGAWAIGLSNDTSTAFSDTDDEHDFARHNGGYAARTFAVTVAIPELARAGRIRFAVRRSNSGIDDVAAGEVTMENGRVTVPNVGPLDLITLRQIRGRR